MRHPLAIATSLALTLATTAGAQTPNFGTGTDTHVRMWSATAANIQTQTYVCPSTSANTIGSCGLTGASTIATASATGGALRVRSQLTLANQGPVATFPVGTTNWGFTTQAFAFMYDQISFAGTVPAFLRVAYSLDGVRTATSVDGMTNFAPAGRIFFGAEPARDRELLYSQIYLDREDGPDSRVHTVDFDGFTDIGILDDAPVKVFLGSLASVTIGSHDLSALLSGSADADFSHTLTWNVRAYDVNGLDITDAAGLRFASVSAVPEPSTVVLTLSGIVGIVGIAGRSVRRRRRAA